MRIKNSLNYILIKFGILFNLDTKYFAKASFYSGTQQAIGLISGLIISYFFGHFLSVNLFGEYNLILSVLGLLTLVTLPGIDKYLTRSIAHNYYSSLVRSIRIKFLFSLIGVPILLFFAYHYRSNNVLSISFVITAIFFPIFSPSQLFNEFLIAKHKFKQLAVITSLSSILSVVLICSVIFFLKSLALLMLAYFLGILIPSVVITLKIIKKISKKSKRKDKEIIPFGIFNSIINVIPWSAGYVGQILLAYYFNPESLAFFAVANRLPVYIQKNLNVFHQPVTAKLASQSYKGHKDTLKKHGIKLVLLGVLLALSVYIISPVFINIIFSSQYSEAISLSQLLSLSLIPLPLTWVLSDILIYQHVKKPRMIASTILSLLKIILFLYLIPLYGIYALIYLIIIERFLDLFLNIAIYYHQNLRRVKK